jgi:pectate lyase
MCWDVVIKDCRFDENTGNGLHPGAGSTHALFENCSAEGNEKSGFFFCVRANYITVRDCTFKRNGTGLAIGTRDCYNLIENCTMQDNRAAGILIRRMPAPTEVHNCLIRDCDISGNGTERGEGQIEIEPAAHDISLVNNRITGHSERMTAGVYTENGVHDIYLDGNTFEHCRPNLATAPDSLTDDSPQIACGHDAAPNTVARHLGFSEAGREIKP